MAAQASFPTPGPRNAFHLASQNGQTGAVETVLDINTEINVEIMIIRYLFTLWYKIDTSGRLGPYLLQMLRLILQIRTIIHIFTSWRRTAMLRQLRLFLIQMLGLMLNSLRLCQLAKGVFD